MDTEESDREEEGGDRVEHEQTLDVEATGSGDEGVKEEGIDGGKDAKAGEDNVEETGDEAETEGQDVEKVVDGDKGSEGRVGEEGENVAEEVVEKKAEKEEETTEEVVDENIEKKEERDDDGKGAEKEDEEIETEIVVVDDTTTDEQGTPTDERLTRRQSRQNRKQGDEAEADKIGEEKDQEEAQEETRIPDEEESPFETMEVLVTKKLLEAMVQFEDPKLQQACDGCAVNGKSTKSGKKLCLSDLRDLGVEKKLISYFKSMGFEWLLNQSEEEVPVALAKEFFMSFKFKQTTDLDADSISFRLFNEEMEMSIKEWSLRMGLLTPKEDEEGTWNEREIGAPKNTEGFDV